MNFIKNILYNFRRMPTQRARKWLTNIITMIFATFSVLAQSADSKKELLDSIMLGTIHSMTQAWFPPEGFRQGIDRELQIFDFESHLESVYKVPGDHYLLGIHFNAQMEAYTFETANTFGYKTKVFAATMDNDPDSVQSRYLFVLTNTTPVEKPTRRIDVVIREQLIQLSNGKMGYSKTVLYDDKRRKPFETGTGSSDFPDNQVMKEYKDYYSLELENRKSVIAIAYACPDDCGEFGGVIINLLTTSDYAPRWINKNHP